MSTEDKKEYIVTRDYSGYVRGYATYRVLASSKEEALENWYDGTELSNEIVRDDTETYNISVDDE
jgi:hypothetical protein